MGLQDPKWTEALANVPAGDAVLSHEQLNGLPAEAQQVNRAATRAKRWLQKTQQPKMPETEAQKRIAAVAAVLAPGVGICKAVMHVR